MSLTPDQIARTRGELRENLELTGLSEDQVTADLQWPVQRLQAALHVGGHTDPVDVWELRDYLERAVLDAGASPVPFSTLTAENRALARRWFRLRTAPRHEFPRS